jgi:carboxymethylenebutenolidase
VITTEDIAFGDGFTGYLAYPKRATGPLPGVVVIQEAFGLDVHIEDVTRRVAAAGYVALAPDCYARHGLRPEPLTRPRTAAVLAVLDTIPRARAMDPAARDEAFAASPDAAALRETALAMFHAAADLTPALPPLVAAAKYLRESRATKVAALGFCMGGGLSARLAAADPELAGAVIFYGMSPPDDLAARIFCPILGLYGESDPRINASVDGFAEALAARRIPFARHTFPGAGHAFFNDTRSTYNPAAARQAWAHALGFLASL